MNKLLQEHYTALYSRYKDSPLSLQHNSLEQQQKRFKLLSKYIKSNYDVFDLGSGLGDFYQYLRGNSKFSGHYTGMDLVKEFIQRSEVKFAENSLTTFINANFLEFVDLPIFDYAIICGTFNNYIPGIDSYEYLYKTLSRLYSHVRKGISFNLLSTFVSYEDENLCYFNPLDVFKYCKKELTPFVSIKHDYILSDEGYPYEFTIYLHREHQNI